MIVGVGLNPIGSAGLSESQAGAQAVGGVAVRDGVGIPRAVFAEERTEIGILVTGGAYRIHHVRQPIVRVVTHLIVDC